MKNLAAWAVMLGDRRLVMRYVVMAMIGGMLMTACDPDVLKNDGADTVLRILTLTGESGEDKEEGDFINSDVIPVFNDNVVLTLTAYSKGTNMTLSYLTDVTLEQYDVRYVRADGHNVEGVDVPYGISGRLTETIFIGEESEIAIVVVRHQAKMEPPLKNLRWDYVSHSGGLELLKVDAIITVHGRTGTGAVVKAEASIQIQFADFADEE